MAHNDSGQDKPMQSKPSSPAHFATLPRWWWIAMMAACLIGLCAKGYTQEPNWDAPPIQLDAILPGSSDPVATTALNSMPDADRVATVELNASLANFDHDSESDGWLATVVLRDNTGQLVVAPAYATFELNVGRFAIDQVTFVAGEHLIQRWSQRLAFDGDGVARVRLRQTETARRKSVLGSDRTTSLASSKHFTPTEMTPQRLTYADRFRYTPTNHFVGPDAPFVPVLGALRVRVTVPQQGSYEAVTVVRLHTPVIDVPQPLL